MICWACKNELKAGQLKCIKCDAWQPWPLRILAPIGIGGAVFVTILTISGLFKKEIIERYFPSGPKLHFGGYYKISMDSQCKADRANNLESMKAGRPLIDERCFRDGSALTINIANSGDRDATMHSVITCKNDAGDGFDWHIVSSQNLAAGEQTKVEYRETALKFTLGIDKYTPSMGLFNCELKWAYDGTETTKAFVLEAQNGNPDGATQTQPLVF